MSKNDAIVPFIDEKNKELFAETMNALHYKVLICDPLLMLQPELFETVKTMLITCGVQIIMKGLDKNFNEAPVAEEKKPVADNQFADFMKQYFNN